MRLLVAFLGVMLGMGALGEIAFAPYPHWMPADLLAIPFFPAHRDSWALRGWMIASNLVNFTVAAAFVAGRRVRAAALALATVALISIPICLGYEMPPLMKLCVVAAPLGLAMTSL